MAAGVNVEFNESDVQELGALVAKIDTPISSQMVQAMRPPFAFIPVLFVLLEIRSQAGQAPVVGFADKDPTLISRSSIATLALTVSSGETSVLLKTAAIRTQDGINIVPEAISFPSTPTKLAAGQSVPISINPDPLRLNRQGAYPATVNVTDGAGKPLNPAQLTFRYIVPEASMAN
jgi:hypothetical protein